MVTNLSLRQTIISLNLPTPTLNQVASQWQLTVVTFVSVPLVSIVSKVYGGFYRKLTKALQDQQAVCNSNAEELIGSIRTVRSFGAEFQEIRDYQGGVQMVVT